MFERLIDLIIDFISLARFFVILDEFEEGIVLTWGRPRNKRFFGLLGGYRLGPGFHLVWPLHIEQVMVDNVVLTTTKLDPQSLTTKDQVDIVMSAIITWKIKNIEKMILRVENARGVLPSICSGVLGSFVEQSTWDEVCSPDWQNELTKRVRTKAMRFGMEVEEVMLADKTKSLSVRLIGNEHPLKESVLNQ